MEGDPTILGKRDYFRENTIKRLNFRRLIFLSRNYYKYPCLKYRCLPDVDDCNLRADTNVLSLRYVQSESKINEAPWILQTHDIGRMYEVRNGSSGSSVVELCSCKFHRNYKE